MQTFENLTASNIMVILIEEKETKTMRTSIDGFEQRQFENSIEFDNNIMNKTIDFNKYLMKGSIELIPDETNNFTNNQNGLISNNNFIQSLNNENSDNVEFVKTCQNVDVESSEIKFDFSSSLQKSDKFSDTFEELKQNETNDFQMNFNSNVNDENNENQQKVEQNDENENSHTDEMNEIQEIDENEITFNFNQNDNKSNFLSASMVVNLGSSMNYMDGFDEDYDQMGDLQNFAKTYQTEETDFDNNHIN